MDKASYQSMASFPFLFPCIHPFLRPSPAPSIKFPSLIFYMCDFFKVRHFACLRCLIRLAKVMAHTHVIDTAKLCSKNYDLLPSGISLQYDIFTWITSTFLFYLHWNQIVHFHIYPTDAVSQESLFVQFFLLFPAHGGEVDVSKSCQSLDYLVQQASVQQIYLHLLMTFQSLHIFRCRKQKFNQCRAVLNKPQQSSLRPIL